MCWFWKHNWVKEKEETFHSKIYEFEGKVAGVQAIKDLIAPRRVITLKCVKCGDYKILKERLM